MDKYTLLKKYYGYTSFRNNQEELIDQILKKRDILAVIKTGGGKSIIFQIPALMFSGLTLVISPLISLMEDQVNHLKKIGINAEYINSNRNYLDINSVYLKIKRQEVKLLYVSPERLLITSFFNIIKDINISMLTIDEAHCISLWGQDFRNSYLEIKTFVSKLKKRPVISAFTATANKRVISDIISYLDLDNPYIYKSSFDRENLFYSVVSPVSKFEYLIKFLEENKNVSGIVYTVTRRECRDLYLRLKNKKYKVLIYHGTLQSKTKEENLKLFINGLNYIMVSTNAFGMGIDKPDIRFVVNYSLPLSIEDLVQQSGRASRDNKIGKSVLIFNYKDVYVNRYFIDNLDFLDLSTDKINKLKEIKNKQLNSVISYAQTTKCLHKFILDYFDEESKDFCDNCSNCKVNFALIELFSEAKKVVNFIKYTDERYGFSLVLNTLLGNKNKYTIKKNLIYNKYFSASKISRRNLRNLISSLIEDKYIEKTNSNYPVLKLTNKTNELIKKKTYKLKVRCEVNDLNNLIKRIIQKNTSTYKKLEEYRNLISRQESIPSFMVLQNKTIRELLKKRPKTKNELKNIYGLSEVKIKKYGGDILDIIS